MSDKNASDNCRFPGVSFKIQFGNLPKQSHSSSENIFKPSKRKECLGVVLSEIVRQVGFSLMQDGSRFSDHVCNPCGRKIRNLGQLYHFVKNATTMKSTPVKTSKRNLDTPDKASPPWRKSKSVRVRSPIGKTPLREVSPLMRSKKSLAFETAGNTSSALLVQENEMLSHMNVEDLPNDGIKFVFMNPSGNVTMRIPRDSQTKTLVKNIATKQWREAINALLRHEEIKPELYK